MSLVKWNSLVHDELENFRDVVAALKDSLHYSLLGLIFDKYRNLLQNLKSLSKKYYLYDRDVSK